MTTNVIYVNTQGPQGPQGGVGTIPDATSTQKGALKLTNDLAGTAALPTVAKVNGTTVSTAGGALATGAVIRVTGVATADWGALNLASANAVTGLLPTANQVAQNVAGDITGNTGNASVYKVKGTTIGTDGGALATGLVMRTTGVAAADWGAVDLANASSVTGVLPIGNQAAQTMTGDVTGTTAVSVVSKLNGSTLGTSGAASVGNTIFKSGTGALSYGALNLAGGSGYVTGVLPSANQASQTLGGDLSGTTASATVTKINGVAVTGTPSVGYVPTATSSSAATWQAQAGGGGSDATTSTNGIVRLAGDLNGTGTVAAAPTVGGITGVSGTATLGSNAAILSWVKGAASPQIIQAAQTTDVATNNTTITTQAAWASSTGSNRKPGDLVVELPTPAGGTNYGKVSFKINGSERGYVGMADSTTLRYASTAALQFLAGDYIIFSAPSSDTYYDTQHFYLRDSTSSDAVVFTLNSTSTCTMLFGQGSTPTVGITGRVGDNATKTLTIAGQMPNAGATGTNRNSGSISYKTYAKVAGGVAGTHQFVCDGTTTCLTVSTSGLSIQSGNSTTITFDETITGTTITQSSKSSDVAPSDLLVQSQGPWSSATTASTRSSGNIILATPAKVSTGTPGKLSVQLGGNECFYFSENEIFIKQTAAAPTTNPTGGIKFYWDGSNVKYRDPSGTVKTITAV